MFFLLPSYIYIYIYIYIRVCLWVRVLFVQKYSNLFSSRLFPIRDRILYYLPQSVAENKEHFAKRYCFFVIDFNYVQAKLSVFIFVPYCIPGMNQMSIVWVWDFVQFADLSWTATEDLSFYEEPKALITKQTHTFDLSLSCSPHPDSYFW